MLESSIAITDMIADDFLLLWDLMFASMTQVITKTHVQHITGMLLFIY